MPRNFVQSGEKHNRLTLLCRLEKGRCSDIWLARCDCGTEVRVRPAELRNGKTKSCGCWREEIKIGNKRAVKHGLHDRPEFHVWTSMHDRCRNPKAKQWPRYGGRGIGVDPAWSDFSVFFADMGPRPSPKHSLDRCENSLGYSKTNCRWATAFEQQQNKDDNVLVVMDGERIVASEAARRIGCHVSSIGKRARKFGVTPQEAFEHFRRKAA